MIVEGVCSTQNADGSTNLAPLGPIVDPDLTTFLFRPFQSSTTYANLKRTRQGVFHVTDDIELIVRCVVGQLDTCPDLQPAETIDGMVLRDCCRWYEFEITDIDDANARTEMRSLVRHSGRQRDFLGFNRARHALLELAVSATRVQLLDRQVFVSQRETAEVLVQKTGGAAERRALQLLDQFLRESFQS